MNAKRIVEWANAKEINKRTNKNANAIRTTEAASANKEWEYWAAGNLKKEAFVYSLID